jgi:hypothetical protein
VVVRLEKNPKARFLSPSELAHAISQLDTLEYPATQDEVNKRLGLEGRSLLTLGTLAQDLKGPGGMDDYLTYILTDPADSHRLYKLYVWIEPTSEKLSGPSFANGQVVGYAEIVLIDHDMHAQFLAQSDRYPYRDLSFTSRRLREPKKTDAASKPVNHR